MTTVKPCLAYFLLGGGIALSLSALLWPESSYAETREGTEKSRFSIGSIAEITGTNAPVQYEKKPIEPADLALADLALLDELDAPDKTAWTNALPRAMYLPNISNRFVSVETEAEVNEAIEMIKVRDLVREARKTAKDGDTMGAIALLQSDIEGFTGNALNKIQQEIGLLFYGIQDYEKSAEFLNRAFENNRSDPSLACNLSAIYLYLGRVDEAVEVLSDIHVEVMENKNLIFSTHFNLACAYSLRNEPQLAITHLELAARADPPNAYTSLGDTMLDNIRGEEQFVVIRDTLERFMNRLR